MCTEERNVNKKTLCIVLVLLIVSGIGAVSAKNRFTVGADYTVPIGNEKIDPAFGIGLEYRFWGIFTFSGTMYNEIVFGADNIFNISQIRPIGLFSSGLGLKIPLGGFYLTFGWQKFFTGTVSDEGVFPFSDSYSIGAAIDVSDYFGIALYTRRLFNFSDKATADPALRIESTDDAFETIGIAMQFHLF
jgi:hypothetical protein